MKFASRILRIVAVFVSLLTLITGMSSAFIPMMIVLLLVMNIYMVLASKNNMLMLFTTLIILYSNYSVLYANFINPIDTVFTSGITVKSTVVSFNTLFLFNCILLLVVRWDHINSVDSYFFISNEHNRIFDACILILLLIFVFFYGYTQPTDLGERGSPKPLYEYSLIFFILLFFYYGNNVIIRRVGFVLVGMYSLQNFIFGGRILGIQFLMCAYLMFFIDKMSKKLFFLLLISFFFAMTLIGVVRGELLSGNFDLNGIWEIIVENGFALDTAYAAYYSSESFVYCYDLFPESERLFFLWQFIKGIFVGTQAQYVPQTITESYVTHYGGGFVPHFFYFYIGPLGFLLGGLLVSLYLNIIRKISSKSSGLVKCVAIFVSCTTFRWYLYTPLGLLRGVLLLVVTYFFFQFLMVLSRKTKIVGSFSNGRPS